MIAAFAGRWTSIRWICIERRLPQQTPTAIRRGPIRLDSRHAIGKPLSARAIDENLKQLQFPGIAAPLLADIGD
jgi:hypothetical protein